MNSEFRSKSYASATWLGKFYVLLSPFGPINQVYVNKCGLNEHITTPIMLPGLVLWREQTIKTLPSDSEGSEVNKLFGV